MSTYPDYKDFGKSTKDFFTKGFQVGSFKLNLRDQMSKDIQAIMQGTHDLEKKEASGDFTTKLTCPVFPGWFWTTKWDTKNVLTQEILAKEALYKGLDLGVGGHYNFDTSSLTGKMHTAYRHALGTIDAAFEGGDSSNPLVGGSIVTGHKDFAIGYQFEMDTNETNITKNNVAASYVKDDIKFHTEMTNAELLWAGLIYKLNPSIELGLTGTYKSDPEGYYVVGAAMKYILDCCTALKVSLNSNAIFGLGFEVKLKPNVSITMSAEVDGNKINEGGHKVGLAFDMEV